jgi:hypothetical protein
VQRSWCNSDLVFARSNDGFEHYSCIERWGIALVRFVERGHQSAWLEPTRASFRGVGESSLSLKANGREPSLIGEVAAVVCKGRIFASVCEAVSLNFHLEIELQCVTRLERSIKCVDPVSVFNVIHHQCSFPVEG